MKRLMKRLRIILVFALVLLTSAVALAQSGNGFDLTWSTVDGGGGVSLAGGYVVQGTAGQPDAGEMSGGGYSLRGGFWGYPQIAGEVATPTQTPTPTATSVATSTFTPTPQPGETPQAEGTPVFVPIVNR